MDKAAHLRQCMADLLAAVDALERIYAIRACPEPLQQALDRYRTVIASRSLGFNAAPRRFMRLGAWPGVAVQSSTTISRAPSGVLS